jgi:hypothetical protein
MARSRDNLESRIERMPFDALKSKCDSVVEDWKSKSAVAPMLLEKAAVRSPSTRHTNSKSKPIRVADPEATEITDVVHAFDARIDHLEKKLLGMQHEHRRQIRVLRRNYQIGGAAAVIITLIIIGASVFLNLVQPLSPM